MHHKKVKSAILFLYCILNPYKTRVSTPTSHLDMKNTKKKKKKPKPFNCFKPPSLPLETGGWWSPKSRNAHSYVLLGWNPLLAECIRKLLLMSASQAVLAFLFVMCLLCELSTNHYPTASANLLKVTSQLPFFLSLKPNTCNTSMPQYLCSEKLWKPITNDCNKHWRRRAVVLVSGPFLLHFLASIVTSSCLQEEHSTSHICRKL